MEALVNRTRSPGRCASPMAKTAGKAAAAPGDLVELHASFACPNSFAIDIGNCLILPRLERLKRRASQLRGEAINN